MNGAPATRSPTFQELAAVFPTLAISPAKSHPMMHPGGGMASICLKFVGFRETTWTLTRISLSEIAGTGISPKSTPLEKDFPTLRLDSL